MRVKLDNVVSGEILMFREIFEFAICGRRKIVNEKPKSLIAIVNTLKQLNESVRVGIVVKSWISGTAIRARYKGEYVPPLDVARLFEKEFIDGKEQGWVSKISHQVYAGREDESHYFDVRKFARLSGGGYFGIPLKRTRISFELRKPLT